MRLDNLATTAGAEVIGDEFGIDVTGVTLDSRRVGAGDLYAALPGARAHGADFAAQALAAGAVAVLTDPDGLARMQAAGVAAAVAVVADPRAVLGAVSSAVFRHPSRGVQMLGVTGTNGKTTVSYLLDGTLTALGATTGLIGTVETRVAGERVPSVRTTPESPDVQRLLAKMVDAGVDVCSMEVSSHALALHRVDGIRFDVVGFTNLSQDHLDFHGTLADYFATKATLFTAARARRGVVWIDDTWGRRLAEQVAAAGEIPVTTVGTQPNADGPAGISGVAGRWTVGDIDPQPDGTTTFVIQRVDGTATPLASPLPGLFNVANTALAFVMLIEACFDASAIAAGLAQVTGVPGRMQRVVVSPADNLVDRLARRWPHGQPLAVVDYAHTPDAVAQAVKALRPSTPGRLVVVLGAGGDRDPGKRAAMGAAAAEGADLVIVTDDNPRSEDPASIRAAVLAGAWEAARSQAERSVEIREVERRKLAIQEALAAVSGPADTVLVAGKGHETGQEVAGVVHPFDDADVLTAALRGQ